MSFFSMKQFDPLLKTPLGSARPGTLAESPAADPMPYEGPLISMTPVPQPAATLAAVSATASSSPAAGYSQSPVAAAAVTAVQSPARVNGTSSGVNEALETISILKAANEELLSIVTVLEEKITTLTEDKGKLQSKLKSIIASLSCD
jgi:hypothetical protein